MNRETGSKTWATTSVDGPAAVGAFEEGLPVRLIATLRSEFKTCGPDEELEAVAARNQEAFDYVPVVERERVIGLLKLVDRPMARVWFDTKWIPCRKLTLSVPTPAS